MNRLTAAGLLLVAALQLQFTVCECFQPSTIHPEGSPNVVMQSVVLGRRRPPNRRRYLEDDLCCEEGSVDSLIRRLLKALAPFKDTEALEDPDAETLDRMVDAEIDSKGRLRARTDCEGDEEERPRRRYYREPPRRKRKRRFRDEEEEEDELEGCRRRARSRSEWEEEPTERKKKNEHWRRRCSPKRVSPAQDEK